jgi:soluble lytic murein transglycosylase-like protein
MAYTKITIKIPEVNKTYDNYSTPSGKKLNAELLKKINANYGSSVEKWGKVFDIPKGVLISFIATESGGRQGLYNFCCYGLMQVSPDIVWEYPSRWNKAVSTPLPQEVKNILNSKASGILTAKKFTTTLDNKIKNALLDDANFNIMCGTMCLRWLIERFSNFLTGGQLNKAIIGYNAGAYSTHINTFIAGVRTPNKIPTDTTTFVNNSKIPRETKNYLIKMLGVNGYMSLIYKDKVI